MNNIESFVDSREQSSVTAAVDVLARYSDLDAHIAMAI
jgi:hypothetical protein